MQNQKVDHYLVIRGFHARGHQVNLCFYERVSMGLTASHKTANKSNLYL